MLFLLNEERIQSFLVGECCWHHQCMGIFDQCRESNNEFLQETIGFTVEDNLDTSVLFDL